MEVDDCERWKLPHQRKWWESGRLRLPTSWHTKRRNASLEHFRGRRSRLGENQDGGLYVYVSGNTNTRWRSAHDTPQQSTSQGRVVDIVYHVNRYTSAIDWNRYMQIHINEINNVFTYLLIFKHKISKSIGFFFICLFRLSIEEEQAERSPEGQKKVGSVWRSPHWPPRCPGDRHRPRAGLSFIFCLSHPLHIPRGFEVEDGRKSAYDTYGKTSVGIQLGDASTDFYFYFLVWIKSSLHMHEESQGGGAWWDFHNKRYYAFSMWDSCSRFIQTEAVYIHAAQAIGCVFYCCIGF
jgi:hypothetical protein